MFVAIVKQIWLEAALIILLITVSALTGYEIGRNSMQGSDYNNLIQPASSNQVAQSVDSPLILENATLANRQTHESIKVSSEPDANSIDPINHEIVYGSINGTKYYNHGCASGNRIKSENRIYFANPGEALLAGYEPAANCKF
jgi:hypothetical protein